MPFGGESDTILRLYQKLEAITQDQLLLKDHSSLHMLLFHQNKTKLNLDIGESEVLLKFLDFFLVMLELNSKIIIIQVEINGSEMIRLTLVLASQICLIYLMVISI